MAKKPLAKISVREIAEDCGVNRQTFYYHFEDIYDMVRWMYQQEAVMLMAKREGVPLWQDGLLQLLRYIEENKAVCLCTLNSLGHQHLKKFFYTDISDCSRDEYQLIGIIKKTWFFGYSYLCCLRTYSYKDLCGSCNRKDI